MVQKVIKALLALMIFISACAGSVLSVIGGAALYYQSVDVNTAWTLVLASCCSLSIAGFGVGIIIDK